jgi:hypothetical protein
MRYYSEEETKELRQKLERKILRWRGVGTKTMFGCPCYQANGDLFAFLVTRGIVVTRLGEADRVTLSRSQGTGFFQAGKKEVRNWVRIPIRDTADLDQVMPFVRKSYQAALQPVLSTG